MSNTAADLDRFYGLLSRLESNAEQGLALGQISGRIALPKRGVYFFREPGEYRQTNPTVSRIVRVGTHAVSAGSKSNLWGRLRAHLGTRAGGGNHRGSIFRLHVGAALQAGEHVSIPTWGKGSSLPAEVRSSPAARDLECDWELKVSAYISAMPVLWIDVPDEPGLNSQRALIERNAIALLSNHLAPLEPATSDWLGRHSPRDSIQRSGLWNLSHIDMTYDPQFLYSLEAAVDRTVRGV